MPEKEHICKLYQRDNESKEKEEEFENQKKKMYRDLMDISHKYKKLL